MQGRNFYKKSSSTGAGSEQSETIVDDDTQNTVNTVKSADASILSTNLVEVADVGEVAGEGTTSSPFTFVMNASQQGEIPLSASEDKTVVCEGLPSWITHNTTDNTLDLHPTNDDLGATATFSCYWSESLSLTENRIWFSPTVREANMFKLSGNIGVSETIDDYQVRSDESAIVFKSETSATGPHDLYATNLKGEVIHLTPNMPSTGTIEHFELLETKDYVIFTADYETDGVIELWKVPVDGSVDPVKLNDTPVSGGDVEVRSSSAKAFMINPSETSVFYHGDLLTDNEYELFMVNVDGTGKRKLVKTLLQREPQIFLVTHYVL